MIQGKGFNYLVRVYRGSQQIMHDLNAILSAEDINGQDVFGLVKPLTDLMIDLGPQGIPSAHRCELWLSNDFDIERDYFVELKKTRVIDGVREAVEEDLLTAVSAGGTELSLAKCVGFRSGDPIIITDGESSESSKVKIVGASTLPYDDYSAEAPANTLTLYDDCALSGSYAEGSKVRASSVFRVMDMPSPAGVRPYKIATLMQVAAQGVVV